MKSTKMVVVFLFAVLAAASVMGCKHAMTHEEYLAANKQMGARVKTPAERETAVKNAEWNYFYKDFAKRYDLQRTDVSKEEIKLFVEEWNKDNEANAKKTGKFDPEPEAYGKITYTGSGEKQEDYVLLTSKQAIKDKFSYKFDITIVGDPQNYSFQ